MMNRQHTRPILVPVGDDTSEALTNSVALTPMLLKKPAASDGETSDSIDEDSIDEDSIDEDSIDEAWIQKLIHRHPGSLPIQEIDPIFDKPVAICTELNTGSGAIDNFLITPSGLPILVECKLWRNPQARRKVVAQILDYAKELARWSLSDLQGKVAKALKGSGEGNPILRLLEKGGHDIDEIAFNDALTQNLRRGRFLLLIVGDGIREGVEEIVEYMQRHMGLHFSMGLVEISVFKMPDNSHYLVQPRVLTRTVNITRNVVFLRDGYGLEEPEEIQPNKKVPAKRNQRSAVEVDGTQYKSVGAAFRDLGLPYNKRKRFRLHLKKVGTDRRYGRNWKIIPLNY